MKEATKSTRSKSKDTSETNADTSAAQAIIDAVAKNEQVDLQAHPAANIFPKLLKEELDRLTADIKERGLQAPIVLHPNGTILDGRHRHKACLLAGRRPHFIIWKGQPGGEVAYVVGANLLRRHLSERQRATAAAKASKEAKRGRKPANLPHMTQRDAALALNVSERSIRKARKVIDHAPANVLDLVEQDKLSLDAAEAVARGTEEFKARVASMSDGEAIVAAQTAARERASMIEPALSKGPHLVRQLERFLSQWAKAPEEARTGLRNWLQQETNVAALDAVRDMAVPPSQDLAELDANA